MQPRISIATLIAIVCVFAADCAIWRHECYTLLPPVDSTEPFIWIVIPILSVLAVGGLSLARQVVRRDEGRPFLLGFEMVGGVVVIALMASYWGRVRLFEAPLRATKDAVDHLLRGVGLIKTMGDYYTPFWHDFATPAIVCGLISMPPLLLSLLGGWLFQKYDVAIVRRRPQFLEVVQPRSEATGEGEPVNGRGPLPLAARRLRPFGLAKGEFIVPDDFDAPLPHDLLDAFEG